MDLEAFIDRVAAMGEASLGWRHSERGSCASFFAAAAIQLLEEGDLHGACEELVQAARLEEQERVQSHIDVQRALFGTSSSPFSDALKAQEGATDPRQGFRVLLEELVLEIVRRRS